MLFEKVSANIYNDSSKLIAKDIILLHFKL